MRCSSIRLASSTILVALQHHNIIYRNRTVNAPGAEGFEFANELILATLTHSQGSIRRWGRRLRLHSVSISSLPGLPSLQEHGWLFKSKYSTWYLPSTS